MSLIELFAIIDCWPKAFEFVYPDLTDMNDGSTEATLAVRKECMKNRSSCNFGHITS